MDAHPFPGYVQYLCRYHRSLCHMFGFGRTHVGARTCKYEFKIHCSWNGSFGADSSNHCLLRFFIASVYASLEIQVQGGSIEARKASTDSGAQQRRADLICRLNIN